MQQLIIGGDLAPIKEDEKVFIDGKIESIIDSEIISIIKAADYRVYNLELPLINNAVPSDKSGPNMKCNENVIKGIKKLSPDLMTLANNHMMDYGIKGLRKTQDILTANDIDYVGTGDNIELLEKHRMIEFRHCKISIYVCSEHEFSCANEKKAGVNGIDLLTVSSEIEQLKQRSDYVIVLFHGGIEYYPYIVPYMKKITHMMVDSGADLVLCQHNHCIGALEKYRESQILYGQGNFIFKNCNNELSKSGILVRLNIEHNITVEYIPFFRKGNRIKLYQNSETIIDEMYNRTQEDSELLFEKYLSEHIYYYFYVLLKWPRGLRWLDRKLNHNLIISIFGKKRFLFLQNMLQCEAHNYIVINGIKRILERK